MTTNNSTAGTVQPRRRTSTRIAATSLAIGALLAIGVASSASASSFGYDDRHAAIETVGPMMVGSETVTTTADSVTVRPGIVYGGLTIHASPASSDLQTVNVIYVLERFNGAYWKTVGSHVQVQDLKAFDTRTTSRWVYQLTDKDPGLYRVSYHVAWYDKATGDLLDSGSMTADADSDSMCQTEISFCETTGDGQLRM
jgi:hypothetical protein